MFEKECHDLENLQRMWTKKAGKRFLLSIILLNIDKFRYSLAAFTAFFMLIIVYYTFADLYRSYLTIISLCCLTLFVLAVNFVAAGSIWQYGSKMVDAHQVIL
jgi:hypothetical protein